MKAGQYWKKIHPQYLLLDCCEIKNNFEFDQPFNSLLLIEI